jgi:hypothetical protein
MNHGDPFDAPIFPLVHPSPQDDQAGTTAA